MLVKILANVLAATTALAATVKPRAVPTGFAYANGTTFAIDGQSFYYFGSNAYWFSFLDNITDVSVAMDQAVAAGIKVIRTWGFREVNVTTIPGGLPQYGGEGAGISGLYMQSWDKGKPTLNTGATGIGRFKALTDLAEQKGLKLIFALTNNWADYGGMDVYTVNLGGRYHDDFFTNPTIKAAFKNYIQAVVTLLKDSPAVFAWELGNEPRCGADGTRNLPRSSACTTQTVLSWADEISKYIRSIDPNHMIAVGDEGFFNGQSDDWAYSGADGVDNEALLKLPEIDFGTFHSYPDWWSKTVSWATQWTHDHAVLQNKVGKPMVSEEYGWLTPEKRQEYLSKTAPETRNQAIGAWQDVVYNEKIAGDMYWQFGVNGLSFGRSTDDGFTIYLDSPEAQQLVYAQAKRMNRNA